MLWLQNGNARHLWTCCGCRVTLDICELVDVVLGWCWTCEEFHEEVDVHNVNKVKCLVVHDTQMLTMLMMLEALDAHAFMDL
jgi:hypothetical protein